ncbi:hypothetical protein EJB05_09495, partial [Eragrostis curvula]
MATTSTHLEIRRLSETASVPVFVSPHKSEAAEEALRTNQPLSQHPHTNPGGSQRPRPPRRRRERAEAPVPGSFRGPRGGAWGTELAAGEREPSPPRISRSEAPRANSPQGFAAPATDMSVESPGETAWF